MKREVSPIPRQADFLYTKSPKLHLEPGWASPYISSRSLQKTKRLTFLRPSKLAKFRVSAPGSRCSSPSLQVPLQFPPQPESSPDSPSLQVPTTSHKTVLLDEQIHAFQKYQKMLDPANRKEGKQGYVFLRRNIDYDTKTREVTQILKFTCLDQDRKSHIELLAKENSDLSSELTFLKTKLELALREQADLQSQYQARKGFLELGDANTDRMRRLSLPGSLNHPQDFPKLLIPNRDFPDRKWTCPSAKGNASSD